MASAFYPVIPLILIGLAVIIIAIISLAKSKTQPALHHHGGRQVYIPGEFSSQMELDLRLPYRRFKQLYPSSRLTYGEYKKLQMQRAFRRSMSSQDNKRMVR